MKWLPLMLGVPPCHCLHPLDFGRGEREAKKLGQHRPDRCWQTSQTVSVPITIGQCSPRPNVVLNTARYGTDRLRVTVTATAPASFSGNRLSEPRFLAGPSTNAQVDVDGVLGRTGDVTVPLPAHPQNITFRVRRVTTGQPTTLRSVVVDGYGDWKTLVGGGASTF